MCSTQEQKLKQDKKEDSTLFPEGRGVEEGGGLVFVRTRAEQLLYGNQARVNVGDGNL